MSAKVVQTEEKAKENHKKTHISFCLSLDFPYFCICIHHPSGKTFLTSQDDFIVNFIV